MNVTPLADGGEASWEGWTSLLGQSASALLAASDPQAELNAIVSRAAQQLSADMYCAYLLVRDSNSLELQACSGIAEEEQNALQSVKLDEAVGGMVAFHRLDHADKSHERLSGPLINAARRAGVKAYTSLPLLYNGRLLGTVSFGSRSREKFSESELRSLETLANLIAAALSRADSEEGLRRDEDKLARRTDQFLITLADELGNPLSPVRKSLALVLAQKEDSAAVERLTRAIERRLLYLSGSIDEHVDMNRMTRGTIELTRERVDIARLLRNAAEKWRPVLEERGLVLRIDTPQTPVWVCGDRSRLTQAFDNLLSGAVRFGAPGTQVSLSAAAADGAVEIRLRDSGLSVVFAQQRRLQSSLDPDQQGTTLPPALALAQGLLERHGGSLEVRGADNGEGGSITLRMPSEEEPSALSRSAEHQPQEQDTGLRVLVVEDNRDQAESLRLLLELSGCSVSVAHDGTEGVVKAQRSIPDVVLCDIGLPGMDGFEVAAALRNDPKTAAARLVAVTGYGQKEDRSRALAAGFDEHLVKPVDPDKLLTQLAPA